MPIFEYRCAKCGHITEFLEKADSTAKHVCEKCGSDSLTKVMSVFSANMENGSVSEGSTCPTCTTCSTGMCNL